MRISIYLVLASVFFAPVANAATFYVGSGASAQGLNVNQGTNVVVTDIDTDRINSANSPYIGDLSGSVSSTAIASGTVGSGIGSSSASANTLTGEIKVSTSADGNGNGGTGGAGAEAEIRERFTLNGSGTFTAYMALDANWNISGNVWAFQAGITSSIGNDIEIFGTGAPDSQSFTNRIFSVSGIFNNANNQTVDLRWYALAQQNNATFGFINASNTATIFFETSDGLTATPTVSSFLSNAVYPDDVAGDGGPNLVPLPASGVLLVSTLAGLFGWRNRTRLVS